MKTLRDVIKTAEQKAVAVGHFNISNIEGLWAVFNSARKLNVPVIIGLSEGERKFFGLRQAVVLVKSLREQFDFPIYINADHSYSFETAKEAVLAGCDSVIFDGTKLSLEENIKITKEVVDFVKEYNKENNTDVLVEAELGYIGQSSKLLDKKPEGVELTTADEALDFVSKTGVDFFAPAVGNIHGMIKNDVEPNLDITRIKEIKENVKIPLVLHGASGNSDKDIKSAINAGVCIVHINTELRLAFKSSLEKSLSENKEEIAPYKIMQSVVLAMEDLVTNKLKVFNNLD
jgi:fructose-bisphosphate aldolase class II